MNSKYESETWEAQSSAYEKHLATWNESKFFFTSVATLNKFCFLNHYGLWYIKNFRYQTETLEAQETELYVRETFSEI